MKIISLTNQKGGCGKTTTAVNLAYALTKKDKQVLLIDLDPQAHATFFLGINNPGLTTSDLLEATAADKRIDHMEFLNNMHIRNEKLFILPSSIGLSAVEHNLSGKQDHLNFLSKALENFKEKFDFCIIDCPPNLGMLTLNALLASDYSIVPFSICELSLKGVENLDNILKMLMEHKNKAPQVNYLITQLDKRYRFSSAFLDKVKRQMAGDILATMIRTNIHLREAASAGKSIFEYKKDARGCEDHMLLAEEILRISTKDSRKQQVKQAATRETDDKMQEISGVKLSFKGRGFNDIYVVGEFNNWRKDANFKLKKSDKDTWFITLPLKKGTYRYKFVADDRWINDPENPLEERDPFGGMNSVLFVK